MPPETQLSTEAAIELGSELPSEYYGGSITFVLYSVFNAVSEPLCNEARASLLQCIQCFKAATCVFGSQKHGMYKTSKALSVFPMASRQIEHCPSCIRIVTVNFEFCLCMFENFNCFRYLNEVFNVGGSHHLVQNKQLLAELWKVSQTRTKAFNVLLHSTFDFS
jgi:hypothetical protein